MQCCVTKELHNVKDAAEKLGTDDTQYEDTPGAMVEATKNIACMWNKMAQLLRSESNIFTDRMY